MGAGDAAVSGGALVAQIPSAAVAKRMARVPWPWLLLFRPRVAAVALGSLSRAAFVTFLALSLLVYSGGLVLLMLWNGTVVEVWVHVPVAMPATATAPLPVWDETEVRGRSVAEVWRAWHETAIDGWLGPAELTLLLVFVLGPVLVALLAWLNLPFVHSSGSVWHSYKRSFRAAAGVIWPLVSLTLACGAVFISSEHAGYRSRAFLPQLEARLRLMACISVANWLVVWWLRGAVRGSEPGLPDSELPPRCEGCGYDLTHQPADGRCSECGLTLALSLNPQLNRPGSAWAGRKTTVGWLVTSREVLRRPGAFYRALRVRTPATAERGFAERNYVALGCGALIWIATIMLVDAWGSGFRNMRPPDIVMPGVVVLLGTFGCWVGHRVIAAIVVSSWLARNALPDFRWAAKVVTYETSFLWAFCCSWGLLITSAALGGNWISALLGYGGWNPLGEMFALMGGTVVLAVLWIWRYEVAYRAIRWSNF
jgi:hypothetical protein